MKPPYPFIEDPSPDGKMLMNEPTKCATCKARCHMHDRFLVPHSGIVHYIEPFDLNRNNYRRDYADSHTYKEAVKHVKREMKRIKPSRERKYPHNYLHGNAIHESGLHKSFRYNKGWNCAKCESLLSAENGRLYVIRRILIRYDY